MKRQFLDISCMLLVGGRRSKEYCEVVNTVYVNSHGQLQAKDTRHHKVKNGNRKHINLVERISCTVPVHTCLCNVTLTRVIWLTLITPAAGRNREWHGEGFIKKWVMMNV